MLCPSRRYVTVAIVAVILGAVTLGTATTVKQGVAQQTPSMPGPKALLQVPGSPLFPGGVPFPAPVKNPAAGDPAGIDRGMQGFPSMNCAGSHAPNGRGGMGRARSAR